MVRAVAGFSQAADSRVHEGSHRTRLVGLTHKDLHEARAHSPPGAGGAGLASCEFTPGPLDYSTGTSQRTSLAFLEDLVDKGRFPELDIETPMIWDGVPA